MQWQIFYPALRVSTLYARTCATPIIVLCQPLITNPHKYKRQSRYAEKKRRSLVKRFINKINYVSVNQSLLLGSSYAKLNKKLSTNFVNRFNGDKV